MASVQFDFYELMDKLKSIPGLDFRMTEDSKPLTPYHAELEIIDPDGQVGVRVICDERNSGLVIHDRLYNEYPGLTAEEALHFIFYPEEAEEE